jgi:hypothetical protein
LKAAIGTIVATDIHIYNAPSPNTWEVVIPAVLGILGVLVGAWVTNSGQQRRDRASTAQGVRGQALQAGSAILTNLGNVSTLLQFASRLKDEGDTPSEDTKQKAREAQDQATISTAAALQAASLLAGVADNEVALQGAKLHSELVGMSNELMPALREGRFDEAQAAFDVRKAAIERDNNILVFMVQSREQLATAGWLTGSAFFRSRKEATLHHDTL